MLYVHRQIPLPAETKTASNTYTITCSSHTNEAAIVTWTKGDTFIGQNDANFSPMPGACFQPTLSKPICSYTV